MQVHMHIRCDGPHGPMVQSVVWYTSYKHFLSSPLVTVCILMKMAQNKKLETMSERIFLR